MTYTMEKAGKLALICAISALLLGIINSMTRAGHSRTEKD